MMAESPDLVEVKVPGRSRRVNLHLNVGSEDHRVRAFVATVDLGRLPWTVQWQRCCGNIDSIWIEGKVGAEPISGY